MDEICGWKYIYMDAVDSTNLEAKRRAQTWDREDMLIHAATQTSGRGRLMRRWSSPAGAGVWMTQLFAPRGISAQDAGGAVFLAAVGLCRALRRMTGSDVLIKWPNDLVLNGKKICGALAECAMTGDMCDWIALGTGLNLSRAALPSELIYASGILEETGLSLGHREIFEAFLPEFDRLRLIWEAQGLTPIIDEMRPISATLMREVRVNGEPAFALDVASGGELVIRTSDGAVKKVLAGDVSVRGITDYA